jgi:hypothetical protein
MLIAATGNLSLGDTTTVRPLGKVIVWDGIWSTLVSAAGAAPTPLNASKTVTNKKYNTSRRALLVILTSLCASAALSVITPMLVCPH